MQSSRLRNRLLAQTGQFRAATAYCGVRFLSQVQVAARGMEVTEALAKGIIAVFAAILIGLGVVAFAKPDLVRRFLSGFAQNMSVHFLELALRTIVGVAFLACAASVPYESTFRLVGWILVCTTAVLLLIPWRVHRRFALEAVPKALEYTGVIGVSSIAMGVCLLFGLTSGGEI